MTVVVPEHLHEHLSDPKVAPEEKAQALYDHIANPKTAQISASRRPGRVGIHWSTSYSAGDRFSRSGDISTKDDGTGGPGVHHPYQVVLHGDIASGNQHLADMGERDKHAVYSYDTSEKEVPYKPGENVRVHGISWAAGRKAKTPNTHVELPARFQA
jgi:hypothetical protein